MARTSAFTVTEAASLRALSDVGVLARMRVAVAEQRRWAAEIARCSAEIARRSTAELGHEGLAQRSGSRTAVDLVQTITGDSRSRARAAVNVGGMLMGESPWLAAVARAVQNGQASADAADAIRIGLGEPSAAVAADDLGEAARRLLVGASSSTPEVLARDARVERALLDEAGVADRERALRDQRYLRLIPRADGMTRLAGLLDPESAALIVDVVDRVTSPRLGGPRFVDPDRRAAAERIVRDERTPEQIVCDSVVDLIRIGAAADPAHVHSPKTPEVRVHVALAELERGEGHGTLESSGAIVSIPTVERRACVSGIEPVVFGRGGNPLDLGRRERLFTSAQKRALVAQSMRDGTRGCAAEGCPRPPSWTETHHIVPWSRGGRTDVRNGVLLCRHHHLLAHDRGWQISRDGMGRVRIVIPVGDRIRA